MAQVKQQSARQTERQTARRVAVDAVARARKERVERCDRIAAAAVDVLTALAQRDAAIAGFEAKAGAALNHMIDTEDLSLAEAVQWLDAQVSMREATRLRRLNEDSAEENSADHGQSESSSSPLLSAPHTV